MTTAIRHISSNDWQKFKQVIDNLRDKLIINLLYDTACTVSELCKIKIEDVDLKKGLIYISADNTRTGQAKVVRFSKATSADLKAYLAAIKNTRNFLFCSRKAKTITPRRIQQITHHYAEKAGIQSAYSHDKRGRSLHAITPHTLRCTHIVQALSKEVNVLAIYQHAGFKRFTSMRGYIDLIQERLSGNRQQIVYRTAKSFDGLPEASIAELARKGNEEAMEFLLQKYKGFIYYKSQSLFVIGAEKEDMLQEGMIGLYKAVRDFLPERLLSFRNFAELCITRQMITAITRVNRKKHIPMNSCVSLEATIHCAGSDQIWLDVLASPTNSPEQIFIDHELTGDLKNFIQGSLSELERLIFFLRAEGYSYQEISRKIGKRIKTVDNALQKVKKKIVLSKIFHKEERLLSN